MLLLTPCLDDLRHAVIICALMDTWMATLIVSSGAHPSRSAQNVLLRISLNQITWFLTFVHVGSGLLVNYPPLLLHHC